MEVLKNRSSIGFLNDEFNDNPSISSGDPWGETVEMKNPSLGPYPKDFSTVS